MGISGVPDAHGPVALESFQPGQHGLGDLALAADAVLPWLKGFKGHGPVRVGNAAYAHSQYDVYGEMVLASTPFFFDRRLDRIDLKRAFENVIQLVNMAGKLFDRPDSGIWEFRSEKRHYVFSKLMCWVAVDRGLKIAEKVGRLGEFEHWRELRTRMRREIETQGWNSEKGCYTQTWCNADPDASNLLMSTMNFHPPTNEKLRSTIEQYEKMLMSGGYVFRYRNQDDFGVPQNAFTICTFWMIDALAALGRTQEARTIFSQVLSHTNHVGLLSEDIDPVSGELWGNFPQTYSHVGIINSAFGLSKGWEDAF
jgi:GH15 family glucan-1,4-alpha-glucosidase